jgi:hypothetical protein
MNFRRWSLHSTPHSLYKGPAHVLRCPRSSTFIAVFPNPHSQFCPLKLPPQKRPTNGHAEAALITCVSWLGDGLRLIIARATAIRDAFDSTSFALLFFAVVIDNPFSVFKADIILRLVCCLSTTCLQTLLAVFPHKTLSRSQSGDTASTAHLG